MSSPLPVDFIAHKRDAGSHSPLDIHWMIQAFLKGEFTDYQMTAWLMAVYLNGLNDIEMVALTEAMLHSGSITKRRAGGPPRIDKHSTGGVGDKISLPLAAITAACGLHVPMIAGRGLGHTGGTLDKLESISGFTVQVDQKTFERNVKTVGTSIIGQSSTIAPADRRIYALRDVTGTVACRPLIVASILSKKLAAGLDGLVLDVKVGRGAFMQTAPLAKALATSLVEVATKLGTPTTARLTNMDVPLGRSIGNALEVVESIEILKGEGPADSTELTLLLAEDMLLLSQVCSTRDQARRLAQSQITSGRAFETFVRMVATQGGDTNVVVHPERLPRARYRVSVKSRQKGYVADIHPRELAQLALLLGAGRRTALDSIDPAVGIEVHAKVGDRIAVGDVLCTLHVQKKSKTYEENARRAFRIGSKRVERPALSYGKLIVAKS